ncbi:MAG TPA: acyl-CoA dehydrogenase family protein [Dehalococcoidia bacterium]|nr:acyl-CoA dehydrogenase family protein [Dehalococcoidia bacterium]
MDFALNETQRQIQDLARTFARERLKPIASEHDSRPDPESCLPLDLYREANHLGFNKTLIPERYGGLGLGELETCLIVEQLAWADAGFATEYFVHAMQLLTVGDAATESQKERFYRACVNDPDDMYFMGVAGTEHGTVGPGLTPREYLTNPDVPSGAAPPPPPGLTAADLIDVKTVATADGDDYVINGLKRFITGAGLNKLYLVYVRWDGNGAEPGDVGQILVPAETPGVRIGHIEDKMGHRLAQNGEVFFDDVRVPRDNVMTSMMERRNFSRGGDVEVAAVFAGISRRAYEEALAYAKERFKGGKYIVDHQAVQLMLTDMAVKTHLSELITMRAAWQNDQGTGYTAHNDMAKVYTTDAAVSVTYDAQQIFGGYGYMRDLPIEKLARDARLGPIYHATNEMIRVGSLITWLRSMDSIAF